MASTLLAVCLLASTLGEAMRTRRKQGAWKLPARPVDQKADSVGGWWAQDAEQTYLPPEATSKLSQNISDYYYALGPISMLSEEHAKHRVGGKGRVHIFHLPQGPALLGLGTEEAPKQRGSTLSELRRLSMGAKLASFPEYPLPDDYRDPLDGNALAVEQRAMGALAEASYRRYLDELTRQPTRNTDQKDATLEVVRNLQHEFESTGVTVCVQSFKHQSSRGERDIHNVIGLVKGTSSGSVTIGGHFDNLPRSGNAPGAEDDGSSTAAVLAAAKAFAAFGASPKKSIYFVAFGGEEQGLIGSARFAQELSRPGSSSSPIPEACRLSETSDHSAFTMDMIGFRNPTFDADTVLLETRSWSKALLNPLAMSNQVNNAGALKLLFSDNPFGSDHMSFLSNNLPATLSIDNDGDVHKNPCYHRGCDSVEYINFKFASEIAKMNLGAAMRVAGIN